MPQASPVLPWRWHFAIRCRKSGMVTSGPYRSSKFASRDYDPVAREQIRRLHERRRLRAATSRLKVAEIRAAEYRVDPVPVKLYIESQRHVRRILKT